MSVLEDLNKSIVEMDVEKAEELAQKALDEGLAAEKILNEALVPAMDFVGEQYEKGKLFVPEMLLSAKTMKSAMELLRPQLTESGVEPKGRVVIGTVEGDLHDIGQNLVAMMLEGAGFEVNNVGTETTAEEFVQAARDSKANIVGLSALLTTTMTHMPEVIKALQEVGLREKVKVLIGGAPVDTDFCQEIGADRYASDASAAVRAANEENKK